MCHSKMKFGTWLYEWAHVQGLNGYRLGPVGNSPWSMTENKKSLSLSLQMQPEDIVPAEEREAKVQIISFTLMLITLLKTMERRPLYAS